MKQTRRRLLKRLGLSIPIVAGSAGCATVRAGVPRWQFETGRRISARPSPGGEDVYVIDGDGVLFSVETDAGNELWRTDLGNASDIYTSSPLVVDDQIVVGTPDGVVHAVSRDDGTERWRFSSVGPVLSSPATFDGTVVVGSSDGTVYALDRETGSKRWTFETGDAVYSSPTVDGDTVYVGSNDANVYALSATSGSRKWQFRTGREQLWSEPAVAGGTVFVGGRDGYLYALDAGTGDEQWRFPDDESAGRLSSPAIVGTRVFVADVSGQVHAIDANAGTPLWSFDTDGLSVDRLGADSDGVFVGSNTQLYALSPGSGDKRWVFETNDPWNITSKPALTDRAVYVGNRRGTLFSLSRGLL